MSNRCKCYAIYLRRGTNAVWQTQPMPLFAVPITQIDWMPERALIVDDTCYHFFSREWRTYLNYLYNTYMHVSDKGSPYFMSKGKKNKLDSGDLYL